MNLKRYPSRADFVEAMQFPQISFQAKELKESTLVYNGSRLVQYSGGYTTVFPIHKLNGEKYALRLWNADIGEAKIRTSAISKYLKVNKCKYFVAFQYVENAVLVAGELHPAVLMDWVDGLNLKDYVNLHINDSTIIKKLAEDLRLMFDYLTKLGIAHGDLQHGNILVRNNGDIVLVDYDSMYVKDLLGKKDIIKGLPGYQHPERVNNHYTNDVLDNFSQIVIYLSLLVFTDKPELWEKYCRTEDLLFSANDFKNPQKSSLLRALKKNDDKFLSFLSAQLEVELGKKDFRTLRSLEEVVKGFTDEGNTSNTKVNLNHTLKKVKTSIWADKVKNIVDKF